MDDAFKKVVDSLSKETDEDPIAKMVASFYRGLIANGIDVYTAMMLTQTYTMTILQHTLNQQQTGGINGNQNHSSG